MHLEIFLFINISSFHSQISPLTREGINTIGMHYLTWWSALFNLSHALYRESLLMSRVPTFLGTNTLDLVLLNAKIPHLKAFLYIVEGSRTILALKFAFVKACKTVHMVPEMEQTI